MKEVHKFKLNRIKKIYSMEHFYYKIGIMEDKKASKLSLINFYMNDQDVSTVLGIIKRTHTRYNLIKQDGKKFKFKKKKKKDWLLTQPQDFAISTDWVGRSPTMNQNIPKNELWILDGHSTDKETTLEQLRVQKKEKDKIAKQEAL